MPWSRLALAFPCALLIVTAACSDTPAGTSGTGGGTSGASTSGTTGGSGSMPGRVPEQHRATAPVCATDRPPGSIGAGPDGGCKTDAECAAGTNGRCVQDLGKVAVCSYDECATDDDCGTASICECRNTAAHHANVCVHGNCRLDSDCGVGGYCSPSAVTLDPFCATGVAPGSVGYFCHTPDDECLDDADCDGSMDFPSCFFAVEKQAFACFPVMCVN